MSTSSSSIASLIPQALFLSDRLQHGELVLTISQFQQFLALRDLKFNRRTVYRWLNLSKQYLPQRVQDVLKPAPMVWFIQIVPVSHTGGRPANIVIPLRYFNEDLRPQATLLAMTHIGLNPQLTTLDKLNALKTVTRHVQQQIEELEHTMMPPIERSSP